MNKLMPCPFCGGEADTHACAELENEVARIIFGGKYGAHCKVCRVATPPHSSEEEAIEAWNRRADTGTDDYEPLFRFFED